MISVVMTTYKRNPSIVKRAIDSVLSQTYSNWELFVVDDSPADYDGRKDVKRTIKSYRDNRVNYIPLKKNMGACHARNIGLAHSNGEYICFLDDDDSWKSEKLQKQLRKFEEADKRTALVYCGAEYYSEKRKKFVKRKKTYKKGYVFDELITNNFIGGASFPMLRTSTVKDLGGFDENLLSGQDLDMWLRVSKNNMVDFVQEPLVVYYIHGGERISTSPHKRIQGREQIIKKNQEYLDTHPEQYSLRLLDLAYAVSMGGDIRKAIGLIKKANNLHPINVIDKVKAYKTVVFFYIRYRDKR